MIYPSENTSDKTQPHRRHRLQGKYPSQVCVPIVSQAPDGTLGFNSRSKTLEKSPLVLGRETPDSHQNFKGINPTGGREYKLLSQLFLGMTETNQVSRAGAARGHRAVPGQCQPVFMATAPDQLLPARPGAAEPLSRANRSLCNH